MNTNGDEILQAALALPVEERAALAEKLLSSLDASDQAEIDRAWTEEAEKRLQAYDEGRIKAIPADEVFRSLSVRKK